MNPGPSERKRPLPTELLLVENCGVRSAGPWHVGRSISMGRRLAKTILKERGICMVMGFPRVVAGTKV